MKLGAAPEIDRHTLQLSEACPAVATSLRVMNSHVDRLCWLVFWRSLPCVRSIGRRSSLESAPINITPREKAARKQHVGSAPSSGRALQWPLQVAIVVVRERSHLERVGDRCRSTGIRLSQRNSTHMLGTSPLTHEAQHSAACEQEVHHAAPNRRLSRMCRVSAEDFVPERGAQR